MATTPTTTNATTIATSQSILNTVLADVNAVVPNFTNLVNSYRLLVGAAEEIHRIPGASPDVFARSIERFDRTGILIDVLIDLLCCKISFSADFLAVTCAPVDLFRMLASRCDVAETQFEVAEEILLLEVLRRAEELLRGKDTTCIPPCTPPGPPPITFPTSFYQPPPPPPPVFPPPVPPLECLDPSLIAPVPQAPPSPQPAPPSQAAQPAPVSPPTPSPGRSPDAVRNNSGLAADTLNKQQSPDYRRTGCRPRRLGQ